VLVDRGFVPDAFRDPATRQKGELGGTVTVTGLARPPETQGLFIPDNEVEKNRWFWRDLKTMTLSMFGSGGKDVAPFFVEAERADVPGGWPLGGQTRVDLPNNHLQYAITWFGIALCLVVVYVVYVLGRLKAARSPAAGQAPDSL
jgi:surfeit locus 1 family protein